MSKALYSLLSIFFGFPLLSMERSETVIFPVYKLVKESYGVRDPRRHIVDLSHGKATNLNSLERLLLTRNGETKPASQWEHLKILLTNSNLANLPPDLDQLTNLEELKLAHNQLTEIADPIIFLRQLRKLDISHNAVAIVSHQLVELEKLNNLNVSNNLLKQLPEALLHLKNLTKLNIAGNQIQKLPSQLAMLMVLKSLDVSFNSLEFTGNAVEVLAQLTNLQVLKLCGNEIGALPDNFGALTSLKELHLDHNHLQDLPQSCAKLARKKLLENQSSEYVGLQLLSLSSNNIFIFPAIILSIKTLRRLFLDHNFLTEIPSDYQLFALDLDQLDLSYNRLAFLPDNMLLDNLRIISLNNNILTELPQKGIGSDLLCSIEVRHNLLKYLPDWLMDRPCLMRLDVRDNRLGEIIEGKYQAVGSFKDVAQFRTAKTNSLKLFLEKLSKPIDKTGYTIFFIGDSSGFLTRLPIDVLFQIYTFLCPSLKNIDPIWFDQGQSPKSAQWMLQDYSLWHGKFNKYE